VDALALDTLAAIPAEGLGALLVGLLPFRGLDGESLYARTKLGWAALYAVTLTAFWLIIVADSASWDDLGGSAAVWGTVLACFTIAAVGVYLVFRWLDAQRAEHPEADAAEQEKAESAR